MNPSLRAFAFFVVKVFCISGRLACLFVLAAGLPCVSRAQWVAYNDHASGPGTHPNATRYNILAAEDGTNGFLKHVVTGQDLPVTLTIARSGFVLGETAGGEPAPGTPLDSLFRGYVDFSQNAVANSVGFRTGGMVTYTFAGLDPSKPYRFQAGAVRGVPSFTNRWTLAELVGTESFTAAHSAGALTTAQVPEITAHQVALNFGANHTPETGDVMQWIDIDPGSDGTFSVVCTRYSGVVPNGSSGTATSVAYAPTALRLEEFVLEPVQILSQPESLLVDEGQSATFRVVALGNRIVVSWTGEGYVLEESDAVDGPSGSWAQVSDPANPYRVAPGEAKRFYRLKQ